MAMRRLLFPAVAFASLAALLPAPLGAAAPRTHVVVIDKMKFGPVPQLHVGDTIVWVNRDILKHTATARDGSFNIDLPAGAKAQMRVTKAGAIAFYCRYHPGMRGTLAVAK